MGGNTTSRKMRASQPRFGNDHSYRSQVQWGCPIEASHKTPRSLLCAALYLSPPPGISFSFSLELEFLHSCQLFPLMRTKQNIRHLNSCIARGVELLLYNHTWEAPHRKEKPKRPSFFTKGPECSPKATASINPWFGSQRFEGRDSYLEGVGTHTALHLWVQGRLTHLT